MPKKMSIKQRIHAGFILAMAFLLVLASNRLNRRNFYTVEHTVKSVFDDRVVAQSYIYQLNNLYHEKKLGTRPGARKRLVKSENLAIEKLLNDFSNTKLTS